MPVAKGYAKASAAIEEGKAYSVEEAVSLSKRVAHAKFDETVEMAVRLGVNPKHADQMVRGAVLLPHGTGKSVRVVVFAKGEKEREEDRERGLLQRHTRLRCLRVEDRLFSNRHQGASVVKPKKFRFGAGFVTRTSSRPSFNTASGSRRCATR